jgi:hypothetical protein
MSIIPKVCDYHGRDNEPCYGKLQEYFEDGKWIIYCEGHKGVPAGGWYVPKDPIRRMIFSKQNQKIRKLEAENKMLWEMVKLADKKLLEMENKKI